MLDGALLHFPDTPTPERPKALQPYEHQSPCDGILGVLDPMKAGSKLSKMATFRAVAKYGIAPFVAVVAAAFLLTYMPPDFRGAFPDYIAGLGTLAAVIYTAVGLTAQKKSAQERLLKAEEASLRAHADSVTWWTTLTQEHGEPFPFRAVFHISNDSQQCLYDVALVPVFQFFRDSVPSDPEEQTNFAWSVGIVPPGVTEHVEPIDSPSGPYEQPLVEMARGYTYAETLLFRDAHGECWSRHRRGHLQPADEIDELRMGLC